MKKIFLGLIIFFNITFLFSELKIGYVDSQEIMTNYEDVRQIQVQLEKEQKKLQTQLEDKMMARDSLMAEYEQRSIILDENNKKAMENEIMTLEREIQSWQVKYFGPEGELYKLQNELMAPIFNLINSAISKVAQEREFDYILDSMSGTVVYALEAHNVTDLVMKELQKLATESTEE